jgi:hypothetical protein
MVILVQQVHSFRRIKQDSDTQHGMQCDLFRRVCPTRKQKSGRDLLQYWKYCTDLRLARLPRGRRGLPLPRAGGGTLRTQNTETLTERRRLMERVVCGLRRTYRIGGGRGGRVGAGEGGGCSGGGGVRFRRRAARPGPGRRALALLHRRLRRSYARRWLRARTDWSALGNGNELSRRLLLEFGVFPPFPGSGPVEKCRVQDGPVL